MEKPSYLLHRGDALDAYAGLADPGDHHQRRRLRRPRLPWRHDRHRALADWYRPHVEAWGRLAAPATTLWFWNTEVGWATVHPLLVDARVGVRAGHHLGQGDRPRRRATSTARPSAGFPVATEICVFYQRRFEMHRPGRRHAGAAVDAA